MDANVNSAMKRITGDDFHRFLLEKKVALECPACGDDNVAIMAEGPDDPVQCVAMYVISPDRHSGKEVGFVTLSCRNCGFVRHFQIARVVEWHQENLDG